MTSTELLECYSKAAADLAAFELVHAPLVQEYKQLQENLEAIKKNLIDAAKSLKEDLTVGDTTFRLSQPYRKWIDYDAALKLVGRKNHDKLEEITKFSAEIDMARFEAMCRAGVFPHKAWVEAYREEPLTPRVTVHVKK